MEDCWITYIKEGGHQSLNRNYGQDGCLPVIRNIKSGKYKRIVFLVGAGISVAAGYGTFRDDDQDLSKKLTNDALPHEIYDALRHFVMDAEPTDFHRWMKQCAFKIYTQNIDGLEEYDDDDEEDDHNEINNRGNGVIDHSDGSNHDATCSDDDDDDKENVMNNRENTEVIYCHGKLKDGATCINCHAPMSWDKLKRKLLSLLVMCDGCEGDVRPNIVLYNDKVSFDLNQAYVDIDEADLVICAGTSLLVYPFASLVSKVRCDLVIIEPYPTYAHTQHIHNQRHYLYTGDCQEFARQCITDQ